MKKLLAVIIILCVGIMLVPMGLFADPPANAVAKVTHADGTVKYCTNQYDFPDFAGHAQSGDIIELLTNISVTKSIWVAGYITTNTDGFREAHRTDNVVLDGKDYTITAVKVNTDDWSTNVDNAGNNGEHDRGQRELIVFVGNNCVVRNIKLNCEKKAQGLIVGFKSNHWNKEYVKTHTGVSQGYSCRVTGATLENVTIDKASGNYDLRVTSSEAMLAMIKITGHQKTSETKIDVKLDAGGKASLILRGSAFNLGDHSQKSPHIRVDNYNNTATQNNVSIEVKNYDTSYELYEPFGDKHFGQWELTTPPKREYIVYRDNLPETIPCWRTEAEDLVKEGSHNTSVEKTIKNIGANANEVNFTREGWVFTGWNTKPDGTGSAYAAGDTVWGNSTKENSDIWTDDLILYAQWEKISIPIKFEANAAKASGSMPENTVYRGVPLILPANEFTCPGWEFTKWNTHPNGNGTEYADGAKINGITEPLTLYAQWKPADCTVTFEANGGTGAMDAQTFEFNKAAALSVCTFTCEGCIFAGWGTNADGSGDIYAPNGYYCFTDPENMQSVTLYALWLPAQP